MEAFSKRVINIIQSIPPGSIMTYGQIAKTAGNPRAARQVARLLHSSSKKYQLPWHRVLSAGGKLSIKEPEALEEQQQRLSEEGVEFLANGIVDVEKFTFIPEAEA